MANTPEYTKWIREQREQLAKTRRETKKRRENRAAYLRRKQCRVFYRKTCSKCKQVLSGAEFYLDKRSSDGLYSCCKECHRS